MLRPGMKADLIVFDPATVADRAGYDQPHRYSVGVHDVPVNGKFVLQDKVTAERPGSVLPGSSAER
jgi:N-acyl-D-aspartate/D-glutamate deacylase